MHAFSRAFVTLKMTVGIAGNVVVLKNDSIEFIIMHYLDRSKISLVGY